MQDIIGLRQSRRTNVVMTIIGAIMFLITLLWLFNLLPQQSNAITDMGNSTYQALLIPTRILSEPSSLPMTSDRLEKQDHALTVSQDERQILVRINSTIILLNEFYHIVALNNLMSEFVSQPKHSDFQAELDQLINNKLVEQIATDAGFYLTENEYDQAFELWLSFNQKTKDSLQTVLNTNGFTADEFLAYFRRLLLIDHYFTQQTQIHNEQRNNLLRQWQQQAKISFGPAANVLAITHVSELQQVVTSTEVVTAKRAEMSPGIPEQFMPFESFQNLPNHELMQSRAAVPIMAATTLINADHTNTQFVSLVADVPRAPIGIAPGNRAPTFTLAMLDEDVPPMNLSEWHSTPLILSFWTTWCPYCRKQTPILIAAAEESSEKLQFIGVNVNEPRSTVRSYVETHQITYPILLDLDGQIATTYAVRGYPTTYFIDRNGYIVAKHVGALDETQLRHYIAQLLNS